MTNFQGERLVAAVQAVAGMQLMVEDAMRYAQERTAFGRPLARMQVWRHKLAEHLTAIEAARWLTYRACDLFERGEPAVKEISMAKLFACDLAQEVAYDCMQLHGGMGVRARDRRRARLARRSGDDHRGRHVRDHEGDHLPCGGAVGCRLQASGESTVVMPEPEA